MSASLRRMLAAIGGGVVGLFTAAAAVIVPLPPGAQHAWSAALAWISHPAALLLSAIARQRLEAEQSILFHLIGVFITFAALGVVIGWIAARVVPANDRDARR